MEHISVVDIAKWIKEEISYTNSLYKKLEYIKGEIKDLDEVNDIKDQEELLVVIKKSINLHSDFIEELQELFNKLIKVR